MNNKHILKHIFIVLLSTQLLKKCKPRGSSNVDNTVRLVISVLNKS